MQVLDEKAELEMKYAGNKVTIYKAQIELSKDISKMT